MSRESNATTVLSCDNIIKNAYRELGYYQEFSRNPDNDVCPLDETVIRITKIVLKRVIRDNSPTPQFSPHPDGSIDIQWWVGDKYLIITIELSMISFAAWDDNYSDLFTPAKVVFDENNRLNTAARSELDRGFRETEKLLKDMSSKVAVRRPVANNI